MGDKFLGLGLANILGIWLVIMLLNVLAKTVLSKHDVAGLGTIVRAA